MTNLFLRLRTLVLAIFSSSSLIEKKNSSAAYREVEKSRNQILIELQKNEEALWLAFATIIRNLGFGESAISYGKRDPRKLREVRLFLYLQSLPCLTLSNFQWDGGEFKEVWDYSLAQHQSKDYDLFVEDKGVWKLHPSLGYGAFIGAKVQFGFPWLPGVWLEKEVKRMGSEVRS